MSKEGKEKITKEEKTSKELPKTLATKAYLAELEEKTKISDDYLDQLKRLKAEFDNYRKRTIKEKEEYRKYVLEGFLYALLNVVDNIQRALSMSKEDHKFSSLLDGMKIVEKQFVELLKAQGVIELEIKIGDKFDPHIHHAMSHEGSKECPVDTITKVLQDGYKIGDRILRPAMVIVSSGESKKEDIPPKD